METKKKGISPYVYLAIIVLSYLTAGFCQYRLQPILTYLMQGMSIDEGKAGVLVSAFEGFFPGGPPPFSTGQIGAFSVYCKKDFPNSQESSVLFPWESETATGGIALWT